MVNPTIRDAVLSDLDALTRLATQVQTLHAQGRPDLFRRPEPSALRDFVRERLSDDSLLLVADDGSSQAVGYLLAEVLVRPDSPFRFRHTCVYIHHIAVDEALRHQRIGAQLMAEIAERAHGFGASSLQLDSWSFNADAHAFFDGQGFTAARLVFERTLDTAGPIGDDAPVQP